MAHFRRVSLIRSTSVIGQHPPPHLPIAELYLCHVTQTSQSQRSTTGEINPGLHPGRVGRENHNGAQDRVGNKTLKSWHFGNFRILPRLLDLDYKIRRFVLVSWISDYNVVREALFPEWRSWKWIVIIIIILHHTFNILFVTRILDNYKFIQATLYPQNVMAASEFSLVKTLERGLWLA